MEDNLRGKTNFWVQESFRVKKVCPKKCGFEGGVVIKVPIFPEKVQNTPVEGGGQENYGLFPLFVTFQVAKA